MKRFLFLIILTISVVSLNAQNVLFCSGTVINSFNNNPIPNHEVIIHNDSLAGTTGYFYHTVLTDYNGYYFDSIPLQPAFTSGTVMIKTMDCQNYYHTYSTIYGPQNYNVQHDFSICWDNSSNCNAAFYAYSDSLSAYTFHFVDQSTGNYITTWVWDFGDGTSTTITFPGSPNVTHTYLGTATTHIACLTILSSDSCTDMQCETIAIGTGGCSANFTWSDSTNTSTIVQFTDLSQSSGSVITSWLWDFGNPASGVNNNSTIQNPIHTFSQPGIYTVCLTIHGVDSSCFDMICKTIAVGNNGGCNAMFTYTTPPNALNPIQFTDLSTSSGGAIVSWLWDFGDPASGASNTSTIQNPFHTFSQIGNYTVCLTINAADSCFDVTCQTIYVGGVGGCQAYFTYHVDSISVPVGTPVYFTDQSQGNPTSWIWSFGDGSGSSEQNPVHYYLANGTYTVCLTIHGDSCQDSYCRTVIIGNTPGCSSYFEFTTQYLTAIFHGFIIHENTPSTNGVFYWNFGDGGTGLGQTVTHTYGAYGTYSVLMTAVDSSGCASTYSQLVTVYDSTQTRQIYGQVVAGNFPITSGLVMIFSLDSTANYTPYVNVATIDSLGIYYFTMIPEGDYYILAIPILPTGYLPTYYGDVLDWENATVVQLGQPNNPYDIHLLAAYPNATGNGTINGQINTGGIKSTIVDKITMRLMDKDMKPIYFYKVNSGGDFTFPTLSFGTYYLKAEIPGVTSDVVMVVISQENPVASVVMTFTGNKILGVDDACSTLTAGTLYPNPASEVVYLSLKTSKAISVQIDLYNMSGQVVVHTEKALDSGGTIIPIYVSNLKRGIYSFRVHSDEGINIVRKLVK